MSVCMYTCMSTMYCSGVRWSWISESVSSWEVAWQAWLAAGAVEVSATDFCSISIVWISKSKEEEEGDV